MKDGGLLEGLLWSGSLGAEFVQVMPKSSMRSLLMVSMSVWRRILVSGALSDFCMCAVFNTACLFWVLDEVFGSMVRHV